MTTSAAPLSNTPLSPSIRAKGQPLPIHAPPPTLDVVGLGARGALVLNTLQDRQKLLKGDALVRVCNGDKETSQRKARWSQPGQQLLLTVWVDLGLNLADILFAGVLPWITHHRSGHYDGLTCMTSACVAP